MTPNPSNVDVQAKVNALRHSVDSYFSRFRALAGQNLACTKGCSACCQVQLSVFSCEAEAIKVWVRSLSEADKVNFVGILKTQKDPSNPNASGEFQSACAFLKKGSCAIYPARPTICRSQGAILLIGGGSDVCPLNFTNPGSMLAPKEWLNLEKLNAVLASVQSEFDEGEKSGTRVSLSKVYEELVQELT